MSVATARICPACDKEMSDTVCPVHGIPTEPVDKWQTVRERDEFVGRRFGEKYLVVARLGHGAMGAVYRGYNLDLRQAVAIKRMRPAFVHEAAIVGRFLREAQICAALKHPNTVRVHDVGRLSDDSLYIVMELLSGRPLDAVLAAGVPLAPERALRIALQIAKSLAEAHAAGVVHRDLKPANVFLCHIHGEPDFVKVLDFGIAKLRADKPEAGLTQTGIFMGTPVYAAPEQTDAARVDARSDLYSLGVILHELLAGHAPFMADDPVALLWKHRTEAPPPLCAPGETTPALTLVEPLVRRLLEKDPAARFPDADSLVAALEPLYARVRALAVGASPAGPPPPPAGPPAPAQAAPAAHAAETVAAPQPAGTADASASARTPDPADPARLAGRRRLWLALAAGAVVVVAGLAVWRLSAPPSETPGAPAVPPPARPLPAASDARAESPAPADAGVGVPAPRTAPPPAPDMVRIAAGRTAGAAAPVATFDLDRGEVSQAAYANCVRAGACPAVDLFAEEDLDRPELPMLMVRHADAESYCRFAGKRLPRESEWLLAAAGPDARRYPWGAASPTCAGVRYGVAPGQPCAAGGTYGPQPPGQSAQDRSPDGVVDLAGNVAEWVADDAGTAPGGQRVARGGAFADATPEALQTTVRRLANPLSRTPWLGFRCARDVP